MGAEDAGLPVELQRGVLHVDVIDPVRELVDEPGRIHHLPVQVARVEIEPERLPPADGFESPACRHDVKGDLGGMYFEREFHAALVIDVQYRVPHLCEVPVALLDHLIGDRGKTIEEMPERGTGETVDHVYAEITGGARGVLHRLHGPGPFFLRVPCARDRGEAVGSAVVVRVAHELSGKVMANRVQAQPVLSKDGALSFAIALVHGGLLYVEVVTPARKFESIVAP